MSDSVDLTGDGGVLKTTVRRAKPDAIAPSETLPLLDVHYEGILAETGDIFDTTHEDNTIFTFELGKGSVIKAWDIALRTMKVGEVAKITCKPEYAYGSAGSPPDVPPEYLSVLNFELVAWTEAIKTVVLLTENVLEKIKVYTIWTAKLSQLLSWEILRTLFPLMFATFRSTLIFEVELVACRPRKGSSLGSASDERARLEELKKQRELAAAVKEEEKRKREEAKATAAARIQAKLEAKKGKGKGKAT
ncbi:hypothetical protein F511_06050 [Dorcoceras hygrometricum]|uniref:peptidylprolyl isomerase n=1 Tax=Dorcoceras hygrometricum TaxID=472368 RepID=A0A2Z7AW92_9LAMI|nr:hypothetical protein F511_06050 [Dorcoceras hygrometricum]